MMNDRRRKTEEVQYRSAGQTGFTLIEGMIAAAILAVGLLALAGMQGTSLSKNVDAKELAQVTILNSDLMERIKFNRGRALAYNLIDTNNAATQPPGTEPMARGDYTQWQTFLNNSGLANVRGTVQVVQLDPSPAQNPITLNRFAVNVMINWTTTGGVPRNRRVMFATVVAPE